MDDLDLIDEETRLIEEDQVRQHYQDCKNEFSKALYEGNQRRVKSTSKRYRYAEEEYLLVRDGRIRLR